MATLTYNVSGVTLQNILLTANSTLILNGAVDGQFVTLEIVQNSTGGYTLTSTQITGLVTPQTAANSTTYQTVFYSAINNTWNAAPPNTIGTGSGIQAAYTAAGAVALQPGLITLGGASAQAYTLALPTTGTQDGLTMQFSIITAHAHTLTTPASGINGGYDTVTFAAIGDTITLKASGAVWYRVAGAGTNTLSEV
jgi:hypothetical protein